MSLVVPADFVGEGAADVNPLFEDLGFWYDLTATGNLADASGNGNTATAYGTPSIVSGGGPGGQDVVSFDGTDDYYAIAHASPFTVFGGGVSWTWSGWHWLPTGSLGDFPTIMTKRSGAEEWQVYSGDIAKFQHYSSQGNKDSGLTIARETWYHFAVVYDAPTKTLSIHRDGNATPVATETYGAHAATNTGPINIGRFTGGGYFFKGRMFSVNKWTRAITTAQIAELFNAGSGLTFAQAAA